MPRCYHHNALSSSSGKSEADYQGGENVGMLRKGIAGIIGSYQRFISPALPSSCRFTPTCSEYARQAVIKHGVLKGIWLGTKRILKCHPFNPGGSDPIP